MQINGAGATFPYPIYSKWFAEYNKLHPNVADQLPVDRIRRRHPPAHEPDGVLRRHRRTDDARSRCRQRPARSCTCPTVLGAVVPVYNMPGVERASSKFTGRCLPTSSSARSRSGTTRRIAKLNPGVNLPATDITVVHRSDGSGTTLHLGRLPREGLAGVEDEGRRRDVGELAGRRRRQGQRGRRRASSRRRPDRSATSS